MGRAFEAPLVVHVAGWCLGINGHRLKDSDHTEQVGEGLGVGREGEAKLARLETDSGSRGSRVLGKQSLSSRAGCILWGAWCKMKM